MHNLLNSSCGQVAPELRPYILTYSPSSSLLCPFGLGSQWKGGQWIPLGPGRLQPPCHIPIPLTQGGWMDRLHKAPDSESLAHALADAEGPFLAIAFLPQSSRPLVWAGEQDLSSVGDSIRTGLYLLSVTCPASQCCPGLADAHRCRIPRRDQGPRLGPGSFPGIIPAFSFILIYLFIWFMGFFLGGGWLVSSHSSGP